MPIFLGLMSGTSVDGIDAAVVEIGAHKAFSVKATHHHDIPASLRAEVEALMLPGPNEIDRMGEVDVRLGHLFADAALAALVKAGLPPQDVRAIGSHGQTVRHRPGTASPFTLQIGNPAVIAERTGIITVADFRRRDMAAGGEGAPLVPAFHDWLFRSTKRNRAIVNIGGIANITYLPADTNSAVQGFGIVLSTQRAALSACDAYTKVTLHEIGHGLGLGDADAAPGRSVMAMLGGPDDRWHQVAASPTLCDIAQATRAAY